MIFQNHSVFINNNNNNNNNNNSFLFVDNFYSNHSNQGNRLMDKNEIKILFGIIMGTLCLVTTIGNLCVIYRYRKASMVIIY
jgi:hypothetical protein